MFKGKKILITGGTGSLGQALTRRLLDLDVDTIRIFSRNEQKQIEMESKFNDERIRFLLGDVRDLPRLTRATEDIDYVFHAAALKHVPKIQYNPFEAVKTNVIGTQNLIDACIASNVDKVVGVSTDKAVSPLNTYGATKLLLEKLFVTANNYLNKENCRTKFFAVRYGNVMGSSGSVIPKFIKQIKNKTEVTITDPSMTRFNITMDEALNFILKATELGHGTEIFVPTLNSYSVLDLKDALFSILENTGEKIVGIRPGEKLHEILINEYEIQHTWKIDDIYVILSPLEKFDRNLDSYPGLKKIDNNMIHSSDKATRINHDELISLIKQNNLIEQI